MNSHGSGGLSQQEGYAPIDTEEPQGTTRITVAAMETESHQAREFVDCLSQKPTEDYVEVGLYALVMVVMIGYYLPYRIQHEHDQSLRHEFRVENATTTLNTSTMQFIGDWNVTFRITNRSNITQLLYQKFAVAISYEDHLLSISTFQAGFYQGIHKTTLVNVFPFMTRNNVVGNYDSISTSVRTRWEAKRSLDVTVKLVGRVRQFDGDDKYAERRHYHICISCLVPLKFESSSNNNSAMLTGREEKDCDVDICHFPLYM